MSLPIVFPPTFVYKHALACSSLVDTAYDMYAQWVAQDKPDPDGFTWKPKIPKGLPPLSFSAPLWNDEKILIFFTEQEPFAFVAWDAAGTVYLVFRGTDTVEDWIDDIDADQVDYTLAPGYGQVHDGFLKTYASMSVAVRAALAHPPNPKQLFITGHSLGSALTTLAVPDVLVNTDHGKRPIYHYNLASPRVGDPTFTDAYNANGVLTFRVVNSCDLVPQVPPSVFFRSLFVHVGTQVDYTAQYGSIAGNHSATNSYGYALQHPAQPQGPIPVEGA